MIEYNGVPVIAGHYNAGPYALNPNWGLVGAIAGSPGISELRIIGNDLFAVGDQGVVVNGFVERRTLVVKWSGPLDVREQAMLPVGIHPNPATDRLYLDLAPDASRNIRILDMTGRTVQGWVMDRDGQVDVSALPAGMYALQVRDVDRMGGGRFVKE